MVNKNVNLEDVVNDYINGEGLNGICEKYHIGKNRAKNIIKSFGAEIRKPSCGSTSLRFVVPDWKIKKYIDTNEYYHVAVSKSDGTEFADIENRGGHLTTYIENTFGIETPSLYDRRVYYQTTGNYWWEQWFYVEKRERKLTKKCPYCDWETIDVENKSGAFEQHLRLKHGIGKIDYVKLFPEQITYFNTSNKTKQLQMDDNEENFVICEICGKKLKRIDQRHLSKHEITKCDYIEKFGKPTVSVNLHNTLKKHTEESNANMTFKKESNAEKELKQLIESWGIKTCKNRKILNGREIDIFLPEYNIGIEYNGVFYHTENRGKKDKYYHVDKTNLCEKNNVKLYQIFEDEWFLKKDLVISKLRHIIGIENEKKKIYGRKCKIRKIEDYVAEKILNEYHMQGFVRSSIYLGAYFEDELVSVMTFKKVKNEWELTRCVSSLKYVCVGVAGKLLNYFIKEYNPLIIKSFADRRWTSMIGENLYTKLGFKLKSILGPEYRYYNQKVDRYKRYHKFNFRKQILHRKYGFPLTMTETEMTRELGYDRIWDCGLLKYVWTNPEASE